MTVSPPAELGHDAGAWLRSGQALEAQGTPTSLVEAVQAYDIAIAQLRVNSPASPEAMRHELGVALMNRGSALQKQGSTASVTDAVHAYDDAIAILHSLPIETNPVYRNCLGAAWLNRGHALLLQQHGVRNVAAAIAALEEALVLLRELPVTEVSSYRLNLAGAELNLANALLLAPDSAHVVRARDAAENAIALARSEESDTIAFADLGLKARRAACDAIAHQLVAAQDDPARVDQLVSNAGDTVDDALALARSWAPRNVPALPALALRLLRFGAQLYQRHQPQFLGEFLLENIDGAAGVHSQDFQETALVALTNARRELASRPVLGSDEITTARLLGISRDLAAAHARISLLAK